MENFTYLAGTWDNLVEFSEAIDAEEHMTILLSEGAHFSNLECYKKIRERIHLNVFDEVSLDLD